MRGKDLWSSLLDRRYVISVNRIRPHQGELTITDAGRLLHRQSVGLSYDAMFGPDIDDISHWQQLAVAFIDRLNHGR